MALVYQVLRFSVWSFFYLKKPHFCFHHLVITDASLLSPNCSLFIQVKKYKSQLQTLRDPTCTSHRCDVCSFIPSDSFPPEPSVRYFVRGILESQIYYQQNHIFHHSVPSCFAFVDENKIFLCIKSRHLHWSDSRLSFVSICVHHTLKKGHTI